MSETTSTPNQIQPQTGTTEVSIRNGGTLSDDVLDSLEQGTEQQSNNQVEAKAKESIAVEAKTQELKKEGAAQELKAAIKKWKATMGDGSEMDLSGDVKFKIPFDKSEKEVSLEEIIKDYNGREAWDKVIPRRFSELDLEKRKFKAEMEGINQKLQRALAASNRNPMEALELLAKMAHGKDAEKFLPDYMAKIKPEIARWEKMSPEEMESQRAGARLAAEKEDIERQRAEIDEEKAKYAFESHASTVLAEKGIGQDEIASAWSEVREVVAKEMPKATKEQQFEQAVRYVELTRQYSLIGDAIRAAAPSKKEDPDYFQRVARFVEPDFTRSDIEDIIKADLGIESEDSTENSSKKATKVSAQKPTPKAAPSRAIAAKATTDEELEDGFFTDL